MTIPRVVRHYFDAWNRRHRQLFHHQRYLLEPRAGQHLQGEAIAAYASRLWTAFPDLHFGLGRIAATADGVFAAEWRMRGTNTGAFRGLPPTGRTVDMPGVDIIELDGDKLSSVTGYFDSRAVPEQLGLKVNVQPERIGPFAFGTSTYVQSGNLAKPGAFSITWLMPRSEEEVNTVREQARGVLKDMLKMPGFISALTATVAGRIFTITAWETTEHPRALYRGGAHKQAMTRFFEIRDGWSDGGLTSVWSLLRMRAF
jgi:steroid delta-isomerase-like uncharacterized protein